MNNTKQLPDKVEIEEFRNSLLDWFYVHGRKFLWRRKSATNYQKVIAEFLLQRTKAITIEKYYPQFIKRFSSWKEIALSTEIELAIFLKPIGLHNRRASSLHLLSLELNNRKGIIPKDRTEIEKLPGVGQYLASAILLLVHNQPEPLLDINMAKVLERYFGPRKLVDIRYDSTCKIYRE